jgi:hypothetical protein
MKHILLIFVSLSLFSFMGCEDFFETTIDLDPPKHEPKLALVAAAKAGDDQILVKLTKSAGILEPDSLLKTIAGAQFSVTLNGNSISAEEFYGPNNQTLYKLKLPGDLKEGDEVSIKVDYPGFKTLETKATVPEIPRISNAKYTVNGGKNEEGDDISKLTFDYASGLKVAYFKIESTEEIIYCSVYDDFGACIEYDTFIYTSNMKINDAAAVKENYAKKKIEDGVKKNYTCQTYRTNEITCTITSLSQEAYDYEISRIQYNESIDNPFATPVNVKSNIINGFGYFILNNQLVFKP